ncbi:hypothetical protein JCM3775_005898 [Rhodotorula graminis]
MEPQLELRPVQTTHVHPPPNLAQVSSFLAGSIYSPSPDGVNLNLLVLLHGLGDTAAPFAQLSKSLNLPQTAVLSLKAPERIPLLEEEAYAWWDSFDEMGELIARPNPAATLHLLVKLVEHLTAPVSTSSPSSSATAGGGCGWKPSQIHLFGYAQGGTCAGELALAWAKAHPVDVGGGGAPTSSSPSSTTTSSSTSGATAVEHGHLGSLVAVSAPLLSHPTPSPSTQSRTRALVVFRPHEQRAVGPSSWQRGFARCDAVTLSGSRGGGGGGGGGEGMLRGRDEWVAVMRFWSEVLARKSALELGGDVFEVTAGAPTPRVAPR